MQHLGVYRACAGMRVGIVSRGKAGRVRGTMWSIMEKLSAQNWKNIGIKET